MISGIIRFIVLRVFGARVLLALAVVGWIRNRLRGRAPGLGAAPTTGVDSDARRLGRPSRRAG